MTRQMSVEATERDFVTMQKTDYPALVIEGFVKHVRDMVIREEIGWEELSFNNTELTKLLKLVKIREAQQNFEKMLDDEYPIATITALATNINALVGRNDATWDELGFTRYEVIMRETVAWQKYKAAA